MGAVKVSLCLSSTGAGAGTLWGLSPTPLYTTQVPKALLGPGPERPHDFKTPSAINFCLLCLGEGAVNPLCHLQRLEFPCGVGQGGHQGKGQARPRLLCPALLTSPWPGSGWERAPPLPRCNVNKHQWDAFLLIATPTSSRTNSNQKGQQYW